MPFTIGGDWISSESSDNNKKKNSGKGVTVRKEKRGRAVVTVIRNLQMSSEELKELAGAFKRKCGCGGTVKDEIIELQGERIEQIIKLLKEQGIKAR